jgi:hypothetical protein
MHHDDYEQPYDGLMGEFCFENASPLDLSTRTGGFPSPDGPPVDDYQWDENGHLEAVRCIEHLEVAGTPITLSLVIDPMSGAVIMYHLRNRSPH